MSFVKKPLILASGSLRRKALLEQLEVSFVVRLSDAPENVLATESPDENVVRIARDKVIAAVQRQDSNLFVLAADTIVVLDQLYLGKPVDKQDAVAMLKKLSGRTHRVYTGLSIYDVDSKESISDYEVTEVTFRSLSDAEIADYVSTGAPMDKAGAYGIQGDISATFASRINGCFYNVVGLPISKLYTMMQTFQQQLELK